MPRNLSENTSCCVYIRALYLFTQQPRCLNESVEINMRSGPGRGALLSQSPPLSESQRASWPIRGRTTDRAAKNLPPFGYAFITERSPLSQHAHAAPAPLLLSTTWFRAVVSIRYPCDRSSSDVHHPGSQRELAASVTEIKRNVHFPAESRQQARRTQPQLKMFASLRLPAYISISGRLWDLSLLFLRCF